MDKHLIRIGINNLLDAHCHGCRLIKGVHTDKRLTICQSCPHYKQIRQLGDQLLIRSDEEMKMTVEEYKAFKLNKLSIEEIAKHKNVSPATVYNWKKAHKAELEPPKSVKKDEKLSEKLLKSSKIEQNANTSVAHKLSAKVKDQEKIIADLQDEAIGYRRQIDALAEDKRKWLEERSILKDSFKAIKVDQSELDDAHKALSIANEHVRDLNSAADDLENEIAELKKYKNDADQQFAYDQKELDKLETENEELNVQLSAAKDFIIALLDPRM